jgi:two-component system OmpR family sensor kinase
MSWHRSLYWRIAIGFVAVLAAMLVVQALLFVWVASRAGSPVPGRPPDRFAQTVAIEIGAALEREPGLDVKAYVERQYSRGASPFFVMLSDGRVIEHGGPFADAFLDQARARLRRGMDDRPRFGRGQPPFRLPRPEPIVTHGELAGVVMVPPRPPFGFLLRRYAPTLTLVAVSVLLLGAFVATVVIFGPARRRLRAVEDAARRLGAGDLTARAPARGGDEVAAVASAFNAMADDLAARAEALAAADRIRRQLLADVSHELTTPMTAMRGYLETLTMPEMELDQATRDRYLRIVGDETGRLERIIGDLLDLARLEGGGGALRIDAVPVADLFERVTARHERACHEAGITMRTQIDAGAEQVRGDRDRLEQALQNLAANAIRYSPQGSSVDLQARMEGPGVLITVTDHGPGIPAEHLPRVFDRFYKAEASRAQETGAGGVGGSGLGLSIVKAIVERHGGNISVTSVPGRTEFSVRFPGDPSHSAPAADVP